MNENRLDRLLAEMKAETPPPPPGNTEANVLRAIRTQAPAPLPLADWNPVSWAAGLRFAAAVAVLAVGSGLIVGSAFARPSATPARFVARQALSFEVFDADSFGMPRTLLD